MAEKRLWLKALRAQKDMSQDDVAKIVGISRATYNRIEQGHTQQMHYEVVVKLADLLGFATEDFR